MFRSVFSFLIACVTLYALPTGAYGQVTPGFELQHGDRVVFLGDGLFEVAHDYGWLEYALTTRWPNRRVAFRNIGWSGDTPSGTSRDHFTNPPTPYEHLIEQITTERPTIAFVGYGSYLGFEDDAAITPFMTDLSTLLDTLDARGIRAILVSPIPHESHKSPHPDPAAVNKKIKQVSEEIKALARDRGTLFVDLYTRLYPAAMDPDRSITQNSIHLNSHGYQLAAAALEAELGLPPRNDTWAINIGDAVPSYTTISNLQRTEDQISFTLSPPMLPMPDSQEASVDFNIEGLPRGRFLLKVNGKEVMTASARDFESGVSISHPLSGQVERVRQLIVDKNDLHFHQYRPQNETYLVGFRQYEQGQNARELELLNSFIGQKENEIGRWQIPTEVSVEMIRVD